MSTSTHIRLDKMAAYLSDPHSVDAKKISRHLAQCPVCRSQLKTLSAMREHLTAIESDAYDHAMIDDPEVAQLLQTQTLERFVDGEMTAKEHQQMRKTLAESPIAIKAALHYASHSAAMQRALNPDQKAVPANGTAYPSDANHSSAKVSLAAIKAWLSRRIPLWTTLPTAALASCILMVALTFSNGPHGGGVQIAGYQDNPVVQFQAPSQAPGIGFFGNAAKSSAPFEPVTVVAKAEDGIEISWPPVPKATSYLVRLTRREKGGTTPLAEVTTTANTASFKDLEIIYDHRYIWTLSGKTTDKKDFYAEGGFVFHQTNN